jgi:hypothetical protein
MQLIVRTCKTLQSILPQQVSRWSNDYEPRAFGEWFQSQKVATVLIESGGYPKDEERCRVRRLHFGLIAEMLHIIAANTYSREPIEPYYHLPLNRENGMFDRIERGAAITINGKSFVTDIGYRESETVTGDLYDYGSLEEMIID